jgi:hypothetical protein
MDEVKVKLHRDLPETTVWGYNGMFPGPVIEAWRKEPVRASGLLPSDISFLLLECGGGGEVVEERSLQH